MEAVIPEALARVLRERRGAYNALYDAARAENAGLTPEAAKALLCETLGPVAMALDGHGASQALEALYGLLLPLAAKGWFGEQVRRPELVRVFTRVLCGFAPIFAREPRRFASAVLDALYHLTGVRAGLGDAWGDRLLAVAPQLVDLDTWLAAGRVAAWRVGLAAHRLPALAACEALDPALAAALLGLPGPLAPATIAALRSDPWHLPGQAVALRVVSKLGGFRGFGGPFSRPPDVRAHDGRLFVDDGEHSWQVFADAFGAQLIATSVEVPADAAAPDACLEADGTVRLAGQTRLLPELAGARAWAAAGPTLLATFEASHRVAIVAPVAAP